MIEEDYPVLKFVSEPLALCVWEQVKNSKPKLIQ